MLVLLHIPRIIVTAVITIIIIVSFYSIGNNYSYNFIGTSPASAEPVLDEKGVVMFKYK
jgi:hypothetical protein